MAEILKLNFGADAGKARTTRSSSNQTRANTRLSLTRLAISLVLPLALLACSEEEESVMAKADAAAGKALAQKDCAGCHGLDGKGTAPGIPNMAAQEDKYLLESLQAYKEGKRTHAALRDMTTQLSDADIRNVVAFYAGLPPLPEDKEKKAEPVLSPYEKGEIGAKICANCHGEDGNSTTAGTPNLAGQQPRYFVSAVRSYLNGTRSKSSMEMLRDLNKVDVESLALFYASQTPAKREAPAFGDPAAGEPLSARCGGCHGAHGVSNDATTPSLASQDPQYLVGAIMSYRDRTRRHDVMLDTNTDEEIENLAAFYTVQESKPAERGQISSKDLAAKCDRCHGADVKNPTMAIPKISGQDKDYLIMALRAYRDGKRGSSLMHNMSLPYSEAIIESVATLYANQPAR